jgi:hypothetical protein
MKLITRVALPAAALMTASLAVAEPIPETVTLACHVDFSVQQGQEPEMTGRSDLYVTVSLANTANGYRRVIASDPGRSLSFDTFEATSSGLVTPQGTFRDVSTSASWSLNRSLRASDSQEFEAVTINRVSGELFYQKQITNKLGTVLYTKTAFGPCAQVTHKLLANVRHAKDSAP